jgi:hypothetical protein
MEYDGRPFVGSPDARKHRVVAALAPTLSLGLARLKATA